MVRNVSSSLCTSLNSSSSSIYCGCAVILTLRHVECDWNLLMDAANLRGLYELGWDVERHQILADECALLKLVHLGQAVHKDGVHHVALALQ